MIERRKTCLFGQEEYSLQDAMRLAECKHAHISQSAKIIPAKMRTQPWTIHDGVAECDMLRSARHVGVSCRSTSLQSPHLRSCSEPPRAAREVAPAREETMKAGPAAPSEPRPRPSREEAEAAVRALLRWIGEDPDRPGLRATPARVARAYEEWFGGYGQDPAGLLRTTFDETGGYDEVVLLRDVGFV